MCSCFYPGSGKIDTIKIKLWFNLKKIIPYRNGIAGIRKKISKVYLNKAGLRTRAVK